MLNIYSVIVLSTFLIVILNAGSDNASNAIWSNLSKFDRSLITLDPNAITAMGWSLFDSFFKTTQVLIFSGSMFVWIFYFLVFGYTFVIIFSIDLSKFTSSLQNIQTFFIKEKYFLVIPILFIVGFDWGRWIFSLFHLTFFSYLLLQKDNVHKVIYWNLPVLLFIIVSSLTIMPECCLQMDGTTVSSNYYRILKSVQLTLLDLIN
jgi:hypothetical protein